jgi:beta-glucosidase
MLQKNKKKSGIAVGAGLLLSFAQAGFADSAQQESPADTRAREVEQKMTDEERYSLLYSLMPVNLVFGGKDKRVSAEAPLGAGYVPGVPRLGVPALAMTDACRRTWTSSARPRPAPTRCSPGGAPRAA